MVTLALIAGGIGSAWAGTVDYTNKMSNAQADWTNATGTCEGGAERYNGNDDAFAVGDVLYQTISDLPNGYYEVCFYAWENFANWNDNANIAYGSNKAQVFANVSKEDIYVIKNTGGRGKNDANKYTLLAKVTDGTLKYGIKNIAAAGNWAVCIADKLTYLGTKIDANTDLTSAINNFDFLNCANNDFPGWTIEATNGSRNKCGESRVEYWISTAADGNFDYYQTLSELPGGKYTISASMWNTKNASGSGANAGGECGVYGTSNGTTVFAGVTVDSDGANPTTYTTEGIVVADGNLRIGVKNSTTMAAQWFGVDWIKLNYLGSCLVNDAIALPDGGAMVADTWYYFDIAVAANNYKATVTTLGDIICTNDGTQFTASATGNVTLTATDNSLAATRYYVKSSSANNLVIAAASYSYTVGSATADKAYIQPGQTVTVNYTVSTNDPDATLTQDYSGVKFKGEAVTCTQTENGFTFTVPTTSISANTEYTLSIPAGAIKYNEDNKNAEQSITLTTPAAFDGDYYLYDAANKLFLSMGANYGTRATVDKYGIPFTLKTNENNASLITFKHLEDVFMFFDNNNHTNCWLYTDGGADKGNDRFFTFKTTSGGYYLCDTNDAPVYVRHDNSVLIVPTTTASEGTVWSIKTKAEHDAIIAAYPTENKTSVINSTGISTTAAELETFLSANRAAKDKTSSVGTAKFTSADAGSWTFTQVENRSGATNYGADYAEMYQRTGDWTQVISGLEQGLYKVTVNAFERITDYATCNTLGAAEYEIVTAYFKANDEQVQLASWYSDKTDTNNPNSADEAATAFNNDKYKIELYTYVDSDGKLTLTLKKPTYSSRTWVLFNNVTLTYYDANVSPEDATAIIAEAATAMDKPMKPSLYQVLSTAKSTFESSNTVPNYNALRTAIDNTETSIASYAAMNTNYLEPIATVLASSNIIDLTSDAYTDYVAYKAKYDNYKNAETADIENEEANALKLYQGDGTRYTNVGNILMTTGWKIGDADALTNNSGFYANTWSTENDGTAPAKDFARPFYEMWVSSGSIAAATLTRTITGLTENTLYSVSANVRVQGNDKVAGSITLKAGDGAAIDVTAGSKIGSTSRYIGAYAAYGQADADGKLTITMTVAADSKVSWLAFRDVKYEEVNASDIAQTADYNNLTTAINTAEGKTLGFEKGEYAPYNNIAALEALAAAKAIDQTAINLKTTVTSATTALTSATWTANTAEVNAVYDGSFAAAANDGAPAGWRMSNNTLGGNYHSRAFVNKAELTEFNDTKSAFFLRFDDTNASRGSMYFYGDSENKAYKMPLKGNTYYRLEADFANWGDKTNKPLRLNVTGPTGFTAVYKEDKTTFDADEVNETPQHFNIVFKTATDAGDYTISFQCPGSDGNAHNVVVSNIKLFRCAKEDLNIVITDAEWATFIAPFDVTIPKSEGVKAYKITGVSGTSLVKEEVENTILANTPVLLNGPAGTYPVSGINIADKDTYTDGALTGYLGTVDNHPVPVSDATYSYYVLQKQDGEGYGVGFYKVTTSDITVNPHRAYLKTTTSSSAKVFFFDDDDEEPTAIEGIDIAAGEYDAIYTPTGVKVESLQKGLNIVVKGEKSYKIFVK